MQLHSFRYHSQFPLVPFLEEKQLTLLPMELRDLEFNANATKATDPSRTKQYNITSSFFSAVPKLTYVLEDLY